MALGSHFKNMKVDVKAIYLSGGHDYFGRYGLGSLDFDIDGRDEVELVAGRGVVGDRFFDYEEDYKGQITFFDWAVYEGVMAEFGREDLESSVFRRNVVVSGLDLNSLIGKVFEVGGVRFSGSCECKPCFWMDEAVADGCEDFLKGRGGLRARILDDGVFGVGERELTILGDVEGEIEHDN